MEWYEVEEDNGNVAKERASGHVADGEEDWEAKGVGGEEELVEEEYSYVGGVP